MAVNEMTIQDKKYGDIKVTWDPERPTEVESARSQYNDLKKKGYMAYKVTGSRGERGDQMRDFDPHAAMVILTPALVGG